ncbi:MAG: NAD(P)-dependent glycerol-3-phosphate dehydrogenase [Alphaproteobacteria bacterium]|nr:NAD(P)-dependent glycerol-3-phosphate dehydrogenase [Alphaproteobacteria bacterium]
MGAGAWGTALACVAAKAGHETLIWAYEPEVVAAINDTHENSVFLKGVPLPDGIKATNDMADMAEMDAILWVTPAQVVRHVGKAFSEFLKKRIPVLICAKGIEASSRMLLSDVLAEVLPMAQAGILSGPSFAIDVAQGLPTAITLAMEDAEIGQELAQALSIPTFRLYHSTDIIGAQIGGAVKNVLAIATGISDGKGFGDSARAALTTRGFAELTRFGVALGAKRETLFGLSGLGDLTLTANSATSRNMSLGMALGQGQTLQQIMDARQSVSEGVHTASILAKWAKELGVDMPICQTVADIVAGDLDVNAAIENLLNRPLKKEE